MDLNSHFSLIFIAIHSIIFLSQPDLDQIITNFLYSLVHSIVNLNKNRGEAEHKKHGNILKTHLIVFPCFLWMCIRGPVDTHGKNMLLFSFGPWIECFNMDWMCLELAKLGWSLAEAVFDVYCDVYCSLLCAVKCRCPGVAFDE